MNAGDRDLETLFERDADGRLLERRRAQLRLPPPRALSSSTAVRFGAESMPDEVAPATRAALLRVSLEARPNEGLIPGAIVTVVVTVHDDGDADAADVRLRIVVPGEADVVDGSFAREGVPIDGQTLLADGLRIGAITAHGTARVRFVLRILPGTEPLDVGAQAWSDGVPAIAGPALRLRRRSGHAAYDAQRPFFELEPGEDDDELALTPPRAPARPQAAIDERAGEAILPPVVARDAARVEETAVPTSLQPPAAIVREREYLLARAIDAEAARSLENIYAGALPHGLAALALLAGTACTDGPVAHAFGLGTFARAVAAALPRAVVAARMRRPTPPVVAPEAFAGIRPGAALPGDVFERGAHALVARFDRRELDALRAVLARDADDPFLRGVQLLLAVFPRGLESADGAAHPAVRDGLAAYHVAAGAWLMRASIRRSVDPRYDPLTAQDATLHAAGRELAEALRAAIR